MQIGRLSPPPSPHMPLQVVLERLSFILSCVRLEIASQRDKDFALHYDLIAPGAKQVRSHGDMSCALTIQKRMVTMQI